PPGPTPRAPPGIVAWVAPSAGNAGDWLDAGYCRISAAPRTAAGRPLSALPPGRRKYTRRRRHPRMRHGHPDLKETTVSRRHYLLALAAACLASAWGRAADGPLPLRVLYVGTSGRARANDYA